MKKDRTFSDRCKAGQFDILIIGGGIVGTAILHELSKYELRVALLERHHDVAEGVTKANSGVLHAGLMVPPNSLKAKLNVVGRRMFVNIARELGVPVHNCKKLIVAKDKSELPYLRKHLDWGTKNSVEGLSLIGASQIRALQPNVLGEYAIFSESTSVTLPYQLAIAMGENAVLNGACLFLDTEIQKIESLGVGFRLIDQKGNAFDGSVVIDSAGLHADSVMNLLTACPEKTYPWRGEYHLLEEAASSLVDMAVYPVPPKDGSGLGVHITPTVNGGILLGPSADPISDVEDVRNSAKVLRRLQREAHELVPGLEKFNTIKTYAGVRPKLFGRGSETKFRDFVIEEAEEYPGFVYLLGIESPGLTAAPAIADYVMERFVSPKFELKEKKSWGFKYQPIQRFRWSTTQEKRRLIEASVDYSKIVCHCEQVTKAEVLKSLANPLGAVSINAVRKRTHATLGKCQSAFCLGDICKLFVRNGHHLESVRRGTPATEVFVDSERSYW